jgi:prepilin-type N-terminal cleavage/methylation domain-containing protein
MSNINTNQKGFTILEIVVAITVAGFIMLGLGVMTANLYAISDRSRDLMLANSTAENKFEDLRSSTFLGLTDGTYDFTSELPASLGESRSGSYTIADSTLTNVSGAVKEVSVTILYNSRGDVKTLEYTGYIGELGVGQY